MKQTVLFAPPERTSLASVFSLIILVSLTSACKSGYPVSARQNQESREARQVKTSRAAEVEMERLVTVSGSFAAYDQATISTKVPGRLRAINVDLGSVIRRGQTIADLEPRDYQLRLQQAEAALAQARARLGLDPQGSDDSVNPETTGTVRQARALLDEAKLKLDRSSSLFQQGVISRAQLDASEAEYKVAQSRLQDAIEEIRNRQALIMQRRSELEIARQQLTDTAIIAPFDGVVQERRANLGEYVNAAAPIVTLVRMDPLRFRAEVPERESRNVKIGQQVRVRVEGDSNTYTGVIARLSPSITAQNRVLIIEAEVRNNGQLRPGSFASAEIVADDRDLALAVDRRAVVSFAGIDKVITVEDGKAAERPITIGRRTDRWVEVLSGISAGETVILDPGNLQSGQPVVVVE
ncbi:MAG: efflux RND transporter periplasmic adaptor subunit [Acidobacteriota bacterium]